MATVVLAVLALPTAAHAFVTHDEFDPGNFHTPTDIDNEFLPLTPGTHLTLEGTAEGATHRVEFIVTDLTKVIEGVRTVVLWDRDFSDDSLQEAELAFFAQDDDGNVWALGEYPEEFDPDTEEFLGAPNAWLAGQADAEAGVAMQAEPEAGTPPYLQGLAPDIDFEDQGQVIEDGQSVCVPADCFDDVIVVEETNLADPTDGLQFKYHAPGVGVVRITAEGGPVLETLDLVEAGRLNSQELAEARDEALAMDERANEFAADIFGDTAPATRDRIYDDPNEDDPSDDPSPFSPEVPDVQGQTVTNTPGPGVQSVQVDQPEMTAADPGVHSAGDPAPASIQALDELPRTGQGITWTAGLGALLLAAGILALLASRRHQPAAR
ncbi:MAG TPA: LPXTG cell wall anchor domain-containing protein [Acidimicrobiia bacterium]